MSSDEVSSSESPQGPIAAPIFLRANLRTNEPTTPTPARHSSIFPSSGPRRSTPVVGTAEEQTQIRKNKAQEKRDEERANHARNERLRKHAILAATFRTLDLEEVTLWDLMEYVFNPEFGQGRLRYHQFFNIHGHATKVIKWWMSSQNRSMTARNEVRDWAKNYIAGEIAREARAITKSRKLQTMRRNLDAGFVQSFNFQDIYNILKDKLAPMSIKILESLTTSGRAHLHSKRRQERTKIVSLQAVFHFDLQLILFRSSQWLSCRVSENTVMPTTCPSVYLPCTSMLPELRDKLFLSWHQWEYARVILIWSREISAESA